MVPRCAISTPQVPVKRREDDDSSVAPRDIASKRYRSEVHWSNQRRYMQNTRTLDGILECRFFRIRYFSVNTNPPPTTHHLDPRPSLSPSCGLVDTHISHISTFTFGSHKAPTRQVYLCNVCRQSLIYYLGTLRGRKQNNPPLPWEAQSRRVLSQNPSRNPAENVEVKDTLRALSVGYPGCRRVNVGVKEERKAGELRRIPMMSRSRKE